MRDFIHYLRQLDVTDVLALAGTLIAMTSILWIHDALEFFRLV